MTAKKTKWFSAPTISIVLLMTAISGLASTPKIDRRLNLGAVGNRRLHSGRFGTDSRARCPGKIRSRLILLAAIALGLVVIVATVALFEVSPRIPLPARPCATSWINYTIDSGGASPSIAIDSTDNIHVSYSGSGGLMYATNAGGSWSISNVDKTSVICTSLALDSNGKAHISYSADGSKQLKYATNLDGSWSNYTIESGPYGVGWFNSIALDSNNRAHISYDNFHTFDLKYATNVNGSWERYRIEHGNFWEGIGNSIALDSNNKAHISYVSGNYELKYATNSNGPWSIHILDDRIIRHMDYSSTSIALDSNDKVHISYNDLYLEYATNANGSWVFSNVDIAPSDPRNITFGFNGISLALDSNDKAHISYHPTNTWPPEWRIVKYATNANGTWETSKVDSAALEYERYVTSLALDSSDNVYIAYYTAEDLKYAKNAEPVIPEFGAAGVVVIIVAIAIVLALRKGKWAPTVVEEKKIKPPTPPAN